MSKLFGTDGIRGIADQYPVTQEIARKLGRSVVTFCKSQNNPPFIIIGRDTRASGKMLEHALVSGILSAGGTPHLAGVFPTPGIAYLTREKGGGAGVVISASHNPHEYNGFKIFSHRGFKLSEDEESQLETLILKETEGLPGGFPGQVEVIKDAVDSYISFLIKIIPEDIRDLKITIDCSNGSAYRIAPTLFKGLGLETEAISVEPNGRNINHNCGSEHTELLSSRVVETGADLGLAFDGDGDRLIALDENGRTLTGDQIIAICSKMLLEVGELKNRIVVNTVMSNIGLRYALNDLGIKQITTGVGDRHVMEEMIKHQSSLGGEDSGHIIFSDHHTTGDGILTALQLLRAVRILNRPLSVLSNLMTSYPQTLINVPVNIKPDISEIQELTEIIEKTEKALGNEGRVLVRYSGTEPLCRVMVEGKNQEEIEIYALKIAEIISERLNS
jgi:phosphoglucosamine mutase